MEQIEQIDRLEESKSEKRKAVQSVDKHIGINLAVTIQHEYA